MLELERILNLSERWRKPKLFEWLQHDNYAYYTYNSSFGWKWLIRKRREAKWQMSRLVFCLSDAARTAHGLSYQDVQHRPVGGVEGWGSRGCAEAWASSSSSAGMFGSLSSPACRSCHKALRLEISRILTLQHFIASLWYCVWLAMLEDQARRNTVVSPPRRAGGETRPRRGKSSKAFVKTCKA